MLYFLLVNDASGQFNTNNAEMVVSTCATTVNRTEHSSSTVPFVAQNGDGSDVTDNSVIASLPPLKSQQPTPKVRSSAAVSRLSVPKNRTSNIRNTGKPAARVEVSKRSTSLADLRELSNSRVKRRNINQDKGRQMLGRGSLTLFHPFAGFKSLYMGSYALTEIRFISVFIIRSSDIMTQINPTLYVYWISDLYISTTGFCI